MYGEDVLTECHSENWFEKVPKLPCWTSWTFLNMLLCSGRHVETDEGKVHNSLNANHLKGTLQIADRLNL